MDARALEYKIAPDVAVEPVTANGVRAELTSTPNDRTRPAGQLFTQRADFHIAHGRSLVPLVPHPNMARIASRGPPLLSHFFVEVPTSPQMSRPSAEGGTNGSQTLRWREMDSNLYGAFPVKWWFLVFAGSLFGAGKPFFVPSPAIRFAERAEGVKGPKR